MSKPSSDYLFQLVKSLSKSEKRSFKLYASRINSREEKKHLLLFDLLDKQKIYDEVQVLKKEKTLNPAQLSNMKAHLYQQILQVLKLSNSGQVIDMQIRDMIDYAQLLFNKCLYKQCVKMIDKAKKIAIQSDRSILLMDLLELEKNVVSQTIESNNVNRVNGIVDETEHVAESIKNINIFSNLSIKLNSYYSNMGFIRNKKDFDDVQNFFNSSLPAYKEEKLSFHEKLYLYFSYVGYYFFIQDFTSGYRYAKKWVRLFDENPEMIVPKLEMYIKGINNMMVAQFKLLNYREFAETNKKLQAIPAIPGIKITDHVRMILFKYSYVNAINLYYMRGDFKGGISLVSDLEEGLEKFVSRLNKHSLIIFYYKIACLYFGNDNYKKALVWLNKIINSKDVDLRQDIHSFSRILNLICHYELGHAELVEYQLKSTYRFLLKRGNLGKFQKIILGFMKKLTHNTANERALIMAFRNLKRELLPLVDSPYDKKAFIYFDIISWLESKIEKRPVQEIIREKVKNITKEK
ncbi:MAG: hypothetical protein JNL63_00915 [Bacteroidia bacterium]|nr:hypothetical protein [Bacteroidia bacterium]